MGRKMKDNCRFCGILQGQKKYGDIDTPILDAEDYFSLVSVGAFVYGWLLIIPKEHVYNMKAYYTDETFWSYIESALRYMRDRLRTDKQILLFEHGANTCDSLTGCGTNHAHIHLVPYGKSVLKKIQCGKEWIKTSWSQVPSIVGDREYLLYCDNESGNPKDSAVYVHLVVEPESQYFRKILADDMGMEGQFSYKEYLYMEQSRQTYRALKEE